MLVDLTKQDMKFSLRTYFFILSLSLSHFAFSGSYFGKLISINPDTTLVISTLRGSLPALSQHVNVITTFEKTGKSEEFTIGKGHIIKFENNKVTIKVVLVYGTWMAPVPQPKLEEGHFMKLRWEGPGDPIRNEITELERLEDMIRFRQYESATLLVDSLLKSNPSCAGCNVGKGRLLFLKKNFTGADSLFTKAITVDPSYQDVFLFRGLAREKQNKFREAKTDVDTAFKKLTKNSTPTDSIVLLRMRVRLSIQLKEQNQLCEDARALVKMDSLNFSYKNLLGFYCLKKEIKSQKKYTEASLDKKDPYIWILKTGAASGAKYKKNKYVQIPPVGTIVILEEEKEKTATSSPVMKVVKADGEKIYLEVLYWTGTREFEPNSKDYAVDKLYRLFY